MLGHLQQDLRMFDDDLFCTLQNLKQNCVGARRICQQTTTCWAARGNVGRFFSRLCRVYSKHGCRNAKFRGYCNFLRHSGSVKRRMYFALYSLLPSCEDSDATSYLDVGSIHRAVYANFALGPNVRENTGKKQTNKGWKPLEADDGSPPLHSKTLKGAETTEQSPPSTITNTNSSAVADPEHLNGYPTVEAINNQRKKRATVAIFFAGKRVFYAGNGTNEQKPF